MSYTIIIPSRYGSTRLPGKPLASIAGKTMVERVVDRCRSSQAQHVLVATDDSRIADRFAADPSIPVMMTRADHPSGTDRLQQVVDELGLADDQIVVNVQGDEPLIPPAVIDQVAQNLAARPDCQIATLCEPISTRSDLFNPAAVKVVTSAQDIALYFSRAPIPWDRQRFAKIDEANESLPEGVWWRHIGVYAYRVGFLHQYVQWQPAQLEQLEALEQLRALANGVNIHVAPACEPVPAGVDTADDLLRVQQYFERNEAL